MAVTVRGVQQTVAKLDRVERAYLRAAQVEVKRAALNIQNGAKQRAPVDTGRLRNSITHEIRENGLAAVVGTNVNYAPYVEFGTRFMPAQPFLYPAFREEEVRFRRDLAAALDAAARAAA